MADRPRIIPQYMREDGKYLGILSDKSIPIGALTQFPFKDNGLEHIIAGTVITCQQTKVGLHSCLIELDAPAPQRVRDLYCFEKRPSMEVGEVRRDQLKIYSNTVFLIYIPFSVNYKIDANIPPIVLEGNLVLEDSPGKSGFKYAFWLKFKKELSEEDYELLKKYDIDDINNYF